MDSALQPEGVFFMLSGFSIIALFFVYFCMDETKGLSEKQKKSLYIPGAKYGRKLKPMEEFKLHRDSVRNSPTLSSKEGDISKSNENGS